MVYYSIDGTDENMLPYILEHGETKEMTFVFNKYFDDEKTPSELRLNAIKIYNEETGDLVKNYSFNIKL